MAQNKVCWMIGGAQGSGVDSAANIFSRAVASTGFYVFGKREYYSNIKGKHSYFSVVFSNSRVRSIMDEVHLLATFDSETIVRHAWEVVPNGGLVYDPKLVGEKITNIPTIEKIVVNRILEKLKAEGLGNTVGDVIKLAEEKNKVKLYPIPYMDLLKQLGDKLGEAQLSVLARTTNVMAVAASYRLLNLPEENLYSAINHIFAAKAKVVKMNVEAAKMAMEYISENFRDDFEYRVTPKRAEEPRILINGTSAVALGKIVAGCRFQTYYPITPASDESVYLEDHEVFQLREELVLADNPHHAESEELNNRGSVVVVQSEDEIAAITMATGAALAGARASTATSGPGFSLMAEGLGWAGINEVPVVVTLYQRAGPSTGLPTRHEQGDLLFALFAGHGEFPRLVLASGDIEEAFYDTIKAFNYAERYQTPVIHILDKNIANSTMTVRKFTYDNQVIDRGKLVTSWDTANNGEYKRFQFTEDNLSPRTPIGAPGGIFWNTGDEHDEFGHITEEPTLRDRMMEKRMGKLELADREIPDEERVTLHGDPDSSYIIVSWGSTKGPILDALEYHAEKGLKLAFAQVKLINPFPTRFLGNLLPRYKKIICVEQNYSGQFANFMRMNTGIKADTLIAKYNGRPFSFSELRDTLKEAVEKNIPRIVTSSGA